MEAKPESIIINSCEYTPVYLIPSTSVTQAGSYILTPSVQEHVKPVSDNLKRFYENSGKLNGGIVSTPKPRILKKQTPVVTGNNLKLASFLLPKTEGAPAKKDATPSAPVPTTNNIILKPITTAVPANVINNLNTVNNVVNTGNSLVNTGNTMVHSGNAVVHAANTIANTANTVVNTLNTVVNTGNAVVNTGNTIVTTANTVTKVEVDRKIVRVGTIPMKAKPQCRSIPKIISKECIPANTIQMNTNPLKANHTSVQLLKLGETYHSLNQLSSEQMKIVNQALKMFSDGAKVPEEPAYDPVTNTKFFYKIVSPRDLTVVGGNTIEVKPKKALKRPIIRRIEKKDILDDGTVSGEKQKEIKCPIIRRIDKKDIIAEELIPAEHQKDIKRPIIRRIDKKDIIDGELIPAEVKREIKRPIIRKIEKNDLTEDEMLSADHQKDIKRPIIRRIDKKDIIDGELIPAEVKREIKRPIIRKIEKNDLTEDEMLSADIIKKMEKDVTTEVAGPKVTRSGRTVKLPKSIVNREVEPRPRQKCKSIVNCVQCSAEFSSLYRLQRHYDSNPTHIPAKIHSNLFQCLLAIIKSGSSDDQASIFIQQLEQLIDKLKALMPCLMKEVNGLDGKMCNISEDVGRIFGVEAGKYNLNINALNCIKDKDGYCSHNPAPKPVTIDANDTNNANNEEIEVEQSENCARINAVDTWPSVSKRLSKIKQQKSERMKAKRMRLASENNDQTIEPGTDDIATMAIGDCAIKVEENKTTAIDISETQDAANSDNCTSKNDTCPSKNDTCTTENQSEETKIKHIQFHSAHFDIRSSPIKPSALVKKFQINGENLPNLDVQILRPLTLGNSTETSDIVMQNDSDNLELFSRDNGLKEAIMSVDLNFDSDKNWNISQQANEPNETYMKSDMLFEPSLTPIKEGSVIEPSLLHINDKTNDFFETCTKTNGLFKPSLPEKTTMIEPSFMHFNNQSDSLYSATSKPNGLIDSTLMQVDPNSFDTTLLQDKPNNLFEKTSKENGLLEPNFIQDKSDNFFEQTLLQMGNKSSSLFDSSPIRVKSESSLIEPNLLQSQEKSSCLFEALEHVKERSHNLFDSGIQRKDKDSLIGPSMISIKSESNNYFTPTLHGKYDILIEPMKIKGFMDSGLMSDEKSLDNVDVSQSDCSSNQGHSVLNFLDSLGPECLSYPETEIRNHAVDFQLDLLFNSS